MSRRDNKQSGRNRIDHPIKLSILERIRENRDGNDQSQTSSKKDPVESLRESIGVNLEWILNTRRVLDLPDESLTEVQQSGYVFGLKDFSGISLESPREQTRLRGDVAETIALFEPRLFDIRVEKPHRVGTGTLRFRIEALMRLDPEPEMVTFDVVLDSSSGEYDVKGGGNA